MKKCFLLLISLLLFLPACTQQPEPLPIIRLGHAPHDHHAAIYIAAQLPEYFHQHGGIYLQEVKFKEEYRLIENGKPIATLLVQGSTGGAQLVRKLSEKQLDVVLGGVPAMLAQIDDGSSLKIVAPLMSEGAGLILHNSLPANDWAGFIALVKQRKQPLRIGYKTKNSVQNLIFEQALNAEGISFAKENSNAGVEVLVLNMHGPKNLIPALENGLIDGFVVMQPFAALAEYQRVGKMVARLRDLPPEHQWVDHPCCAIAANGNLLMREDKLLSKLTALLMRANLYLQQHPQEGAELVAKWLGKPLEVELMSLPTIHYLTDFSDDWQRGIDVWIENMQERGSFDGALGKERDADNAADLIYHQPTYDKVRELLDSR
ncbi:NitT/TauT family transport system substrate-binding protein [Malonomonas rubra DSM 5091]|uniref:NitT/TauT family transport system substrate-binding protein n=1 Tax=Malonomonas rubra DSM 5091 TaxID=1122189 RepID=A0A1M6FC55_MALRU|nr:ABC transporter substrate-binding protein [Malonomonas rubra]SHI95300.1 NitT/TauT family transport system substrate-binding protein [Malonomonas rubra DSM 5091]